MSDYNDTSYNDTRGGRHSSVAMIASGIAVLIFLVAALSAYYTVDQGERAVITHYGAVEGVSGPGFHFKMPFVTGVSDISIQPTTYTYGSKEVPFEAYSRDQQPGKLRISVTLHATDPIAVYSNFTDIDTMVSRIVTPRLFEQVKNVFGQFDAVDAIQKRSTLNAEVTDAISSAIKGPLIIDSVQIEDIAFSDKYESAVEDRMEAQVKEQQAVALKQQRITAADAAAYEVRVAADAQAHQIEVQGAAQAGAIKARGDALKANPELPSLVAAEAWDGHLPTTMVPGSSVPFINVK